VTFFIGFMGVTFPPSFFVLFPFFFAKDGFDAKVMFDVTKALNQLQLIK